MDKLFNSKVLDDLLEIRRDGFECGIIAKYGKSKEIVEAENAGAKIEEIITGIKDENLKRKIKNAFDDYADKILDEMSYWEELYYKLGFIDDVKLKREKEEQRNKLRITRDNKEIYECNDDLETKKYERLKRRDDYKNTVNEIRIIKQKYPRVQKFIECKIGDNFTKEEIDAILQWIDLDDTIRIIEQEEIYKIGLKDGVEL